MQGAGCRVRLQIGGEILRKYSAQVSDTPHPNIRSSAPYHSWSLTVKYRKLSVGPTRFVVCVGITVGDNEFPQVNYCLELQFMHVYPQTLVVWGIALGVVETLISMDEQCSQYAEIWPSCFSGTRFIVLRHAYWTAVAS